MGWPGLAVACRQHYLHNLSRMQHMMAQAMQRICVVDVFCWHGSPAGGDIWATPKLLCTYAMAQVAIRLSSLLERQ